MKVPYVFVATCDKENIASIVQEVFGTSFPDISKKKQIHYLEKYLLDIGAKTIVCETSYLDKDYLIDYQNYYSRCFNQYSKTCARLHFFSNDFTYSDFIAHIDSIDNSILADLNDGYLGFSVIKPLPLTFIGKTCLETYNSVKRVNKKPNTNKVFITKPYIVNLLGIELKVNSIPFQEQDKAVSACATTSLWTLFHGISHMCTPNVPSPSEITINALGSYEKTINSFPNNGLSDDQVVMAMEEAKLKLHSSKVNTVLGFDQKTINKQIKEHIDSGIPVLAGSAIYRKKDNQSYCKVGYHTFVILGYKINSDEQVEQLYIHDDRVGPYAKLVLNGSKIKVQGTEIDQQLNGAPIENEQEPNAIIAHYDISVAGLEEMDEIVNIRSLKFATYPKIRLPYAQIYLLCLEMKGILNVIVKDLIQGQAKQCSSSSSIPEHEYIDYKIELVKSSELKKRYRASTTIDKEDRNKVIFNPLPKYAWLCSFYSSFLEIEAFDLIYDTTDIPLGKGFLYIVKQTTQGAKIASVAAEYYKNHSTNHEFEYPVNGSKAYLYDTLKKLALLDLSYHEKLDGLFGILYPPKEIKLKEAPDGHVKVNPEISDYIVYKKGITLEKVFSDRGEDSKLIWLITADGEILIGQDSASSGHPTLVNAKAARMGGEIHIKKNETSTQFILNGSSGRYSSQRSDQEKKPLLRNALHYFRGVFQEDIINLELYNSETKTSWIDEKTAIKVEIQGK